jgi:hypothetical protein
MVSSTIAATTPPWARPGAPSNAGPSAVVATTESPWRRTSSPMPIGLVRPETTESRNKSIGSPSRPMGSRASPLSQRAKRGLVAISAVRSRAGRAETSSVAVGGQVGDATREVGVDAMADETVAESLERGGHAGAGFELFGGFVEVHGAGSLGWSGNRAVGVRGVASRNGGVGSECAGAFDVEAGQGPVEPSG